MKAKSIATGRKAIESLAHRFPQLYVAPADGAQDAHRLAGARGIAPQDASLDHFVGSPQDELREVETPAGPIEVLFLQRREDFETFLQIISHKSQPVPIARTVGAITYRGLPDWGKVATERKSYLDSGGDDWSSEFARLAKEPNAFRSEIIVISEGPYSNVPAADTPYGQEEWLRVSREIRLHHECAHVVCRRTMPDNILPVWDELTADVTGLLCATGAYNAQLAARFLGITEDGYAGGRLEEYLDEDQTSRINEIASEAYSACARIEEMCGEAESDIPFEFLLSLKKTPLLEL